MSECTHSTGHATTQQVTLRHERRHSLFSTSRIMMLGYNVHVLVCSLTFICHPGKTHNLRQVRVEHMVLKITPC